jgi:hypothetical protein
MGFARGRRGFNVFLAFGGYFFKVRGGENPLLFLSKKYKIIIGYPRLYCIFDISSGFPHFIIIADCLNKGIKMKHSLPISELIHDKLSIVMNHCFSRTALNEIIDKHSLLSGCLN